MRLKWMRPHSTAACTTSAACSRTAKTPTSSGRAGQAGVHDPAGQHAINDLKAAQFKRLRHNFLRFNVTPGNLDWFDDYSAVINNARLAAQVARAGGVGMLFDTEQYNAQLFDYRKQTNAATKTWEQYAAQARRRGREVMHAFQEGFPGLKVLMTFAYGMPWQESDAGKRPLREGAYGLLAPFLDGMVEAAEGGSQLIDGWESAYSYFEEKKFRTARQMIHQDILALVADRDKYPKVFSASFGLWMDYQWREKGWNVEQPERNPILRTSSKRSSAPPSSTRTNTCGFTPRRPAGGRTAAVHEPAPCLRRRHPPCRFSGGPTCAGFGLETRRFFAGLQCSRIGRARRRSDPRHHSPAKSH